MKPKCMVMNERSQSEKVKYCMSPTAWQSIKGQDMEKVKRSVVAKDWVQGDA